MSLTKKAAYVIAAGIIAAGASLTVSATPEIGDTIGWVYPSGVRALIDGYPILSYNIDGYTYIRADDLANYGFAVTWNGEERLLTIGETRKAVNADGIRSSQPTAEVLPRLYSDIRVMIGERAVEGVNIDDWMCIRLDDLAGVFAAEGGYVWNPEESTLKLDTKKTYDWSIGYTDPDYDKDDTAYGICAIWEFTKDAAGGFTLTHAEGTTEFAQSICISAKGVSYRIPIEEVYNRTSKLQFRSAPHGLAAHDRNDHFLSDRLGGWMGTDHYLGTTPVYAEYYQTYAKENPALADYLEELSDGLSEHFRVLVNGKPMRGIALRGGNYAPAITLDTTNDYRFLFREPLAFEDAETIRVELVLPDQPLKLLDGGENYDWEFLYPNPGYEIFEPVSGESAVWEFTRNEHGSFDLTESAGTTDFAISVGFDADEIFYTLRGGTGYDTLGNPVKLAAPHTLAAHEALVRNGAFLLDSENGVWGSFYKAEDGTPIHAEQYAAYKISHPDYAKKLEELSQIGDFCRVCVNGEPMDVIGLQDPYYARSVNGETRILCYRFAFAKRLALSEVQSIRLELACPAKP